MSGHRFGFFGQLSVGSDSDEQLAEFGSAVAEEFSRGDGAILADGRAGDIRCAVSAPRVARRVPLTRSDQFVVARLWDCRPAYSVEPTQTGYGVGSGRSLEANSGCRSSCERCGRGDGVRCRG